MERVSVLLGMSAILVGVGGCPTDTIEGDLVITSADDVAAAEGVVTVTGDFVVDDTDLDSLVGLESLTTVNGAVAIGGDTGNPLLASLEGLQNLSEVGFHLLVKRNPSLVDLTGLRGLQTVGESAAITENSILASPGDMGKLTRVGDFFLVSENPSLQNLNGLSGLLDVEFTLAIESNGVMTSMEGLTALRSAGRLFVRRNPALPSCQAYALRDRLLAVDGLSRYDGLVDIVANNDNAVCPGTSPP